MKFIKGKKYLLQSKKMIYDNTKFRYKKTPVSETVTYIGQEGDKEVFSTERGSEILILSADIEGKIKEIK